MVYIAIVAVFWIACCTLLLVVVGNPLCIYIASSVSRKYFAKPATGNTFQSSVSIVIVAHRPGALLEKKFANCLELDFPRHLLEVVHVSDGVDDYARNVCHMHDAVFARHAIKFKTHQAEARQGKIACLNEAVALTTGEILVFSDVDALLHPDAVSLLMQRFEDPCVGGVGGRRAPRASKKGFASVQQLYWKVDAWLKRHESRLGTVTANDGKLYAMRRSLFTPIPDFVTDDLYNCLNVLRQNFRFEYEEHACATVPASTKKESDEIARRRRIVCRGFFGLWLMRSLLNPFHFGWLSVRLFINKFLRRLLPLAIALFFVCSLLLSFSSVYYCLVFFVQACFLGLAMLHNLFRNEQAQDSKLAKPAAYSWFFVIAMYGTFLGLLDFLRGKRVAMWTPLGR